MPHSPFPNMGRTDGYHGAIPTPAHTLGSGANPSLLRMASRPYRGVPVSSVSMPGGDRGVNVRARRRPAITSDRPGAPPNDLLLWRQLVCRVVLTARRTWSHC